MSSHRSVTIVEVAKQAGVSNATVSAVLSANKSNMRISGATQQRVREVARRMGYRPNAVARSLLRKYTNIIGLYCGYGYLDTTLPFFAEVVGGLQKGCDAHRKDLLLHGAFLERPVETIYSELVDGRIDGLIVYASLEDPLSKELAASHLPVIAIVDALPLLPSVRVDDARGPQMLVEYLHNKGHDRLLYWDTHRRMTASNCRHRAFRMAAQERGVCVIEFEEANQSQSATELIAAWRLLPAAERPTTIACWNDATAYKLLAQCQIQGIRVPDDLAVTGYDGMPSPFGTAWRLTTVRAPWSDVTRVAISLLVSQLEGQMPPDETVLPVEFIPGATA
jgi:LacI family transcriptional regulator